MLVNQLLNKSHRIIVSCFENFQQKFHVELRNFRGLNNKQPWDVVLAKHLWRFRALTFENGFDFTSLVRRMISLN